MEKLSTEGSREKTSYVRVGYAELLLIIFRSIFLFHWDFDEKSLSLCCSR